VSFSRRLRRALVTALLPAWGWASVAAGAGTKIWVCDSASDFSAGEARGVAVTMEGSLLLSRESRRLGGLTEAALYAGVRAKDGAIYLATGEAGHVLRASGGKVETLATLPEKEVTALAVGPDGAVYAGTAPGARVYRIEPTGKFALYYQPKAQYVWALVFWNGSLCVGTGLPGEIHRVASATHGEKIHATPDAHVRALSVDREGRLWVGTSGSGLVLRIDKSGAVRTLYDSSKTEVTAIAAGLDGRVWVAAGSADIASPGNEPISAPAAAPAAKPARSANAREDDDAKDKPEVTVSVSTPRLAPSRPGGKGNGYSSEVLLFEEGEAPRPIWTSSEELVFALQPDGDKASVFAATGPNGKLYRLGLNRWSLDRTFDEKQVTVLAGDAIGTNSAAALYRLSDGPREGEYVSAVKDTGRTSRFGVFRWEGDAPAESRVAFSFRSGESGTPDSTWSPWSSYAAASPAVVLEAPPGRYVQWKVKMSSGGASVPVIRRVEVAYRNRNAMPVIDALLALGPSEVFARAASGGPNVFETTAADDKGIFTSLEESKAEAPPRRLLRKGYRTLTWKASDPDGDPLAFDLEFRPVASERWLPLRKTLKENFYSFDTLTLPDGDYVFRLTASDAESNPEEPRTVQRESSPVRVDNTPPVIRKIPSGAGSFEFEAADASSPIQEAEYSIDAKEWVRVEPKDGLSDSPKESYLIRFDPKSKGAFLLIRVTDAARNVASASFTLP
jgi:Two component regulator propeller